MRRGALAVAALLALLPAGCGGNDDKTTSSPAPRDTATATTPTETTPTATERTETQTERTETETETGGHKGKGEDQPGGAGDEEPARSQAELTGRGGKITPRLVQVPPFISVRVVLRSADGRSYTLRIAGKRLAAGGTVSSTSTTLGGLRAGRSYTGRAGDGSTIKISATAEPGP